MRRHVRGRGDSPAACPGPGASPPAPGGWCHRSHGTGDASKCKQIRDDARQRDGLCRPDSYGTGAAAAIPGSRRGQAPKRPTPYCTSKKPGPTPRLSVMLCGAHVQYSHIKAMLTVPVVVHTSDSVALDAVFPAVRCLAFELLKCQARFRE